MFQALRAVFDFFIGIFDIDVVSVGIQVVERLRDGGTNKRGQVGK